MVVFMDLPPIKKSRQRPIARRLKTLMARRGEWARLGTYKNASSAASMGTHLRNGGNPFPDERFEFASRGSVLFGRYVGRAVLGRPPKDR